MRDLLAGIVLLVCALMFVLATPGLDVMPDRTLASVRERNALGRHQPQWWVWFAVRAAEGNRGLRLPVTRALKVVERPLGLEQDWTAFSEPTRIVRRLEVAVDGDLVYRSGDSEYAWRRSTLRNRRVLPVVSDACQRRTEGHWLAAWLVALVRKDLPDARRVEIRCTRADFPGDESEPTLVLAAEAPAWQVQP